MSKVINYGPTDTVNSGSTPTIIFPRANLNFKLDFGVKSEQPGKEVVLTNLTCPVGRPEKLRIAYSDISNIFAGSGVEPSISVLSKKGTSVLVQLTEVISVTDSANPDYRVDLPVSYHLVVKVPNDENISLDVLEKGIGRLVGSLYNTDDDNLPSRLASILRGSLVPAGM